MESDFESSFLSTNDFLQWTDRDRKMWPLGLSRITSRIRKRLLKGCGWRVRRFMYSRLEKGKVRHMYYSSI